MNVLQQFHRSAEPQGDNDSQILNCVLGDQLYKVVDCVTPQTMQSLTMLNLVCRSYLQLCLYLHVPLANA